MPFLKTPHGPVVLTYCLNAHPSETLEDVERSLEEYAAPLKQRLFPDRPMVVGLRLSAQAVHVLHGDIRRRRDFEAWLVRRGFVLLTVNAFPYGEFQTGVVKKKVFEPDWADPRRLAYTTELIDVLADLCSPAGEISVSTVPLGLHDPDQPAADRARTDAAMAAHLARAALHARATGLRTARQIRICPEPEPFGWVEGVEDTGRPGFLSWHAEWFDRRAGELAAAVGATEEALRSAARDHLGVCIDACHAAVVGQDPAQSLTSAAVAGVAVGKVQISNAPEAGADPESLGALARLAEPRFLHQTYAFPGDPPGVPAAWSALDLPQNPADLAGSIPPGTQRVRSHFHVPVNRDRFGSLPTIRPAVARAIERLCREPLCRHWEIETYTWPVLFEIREASPDEARRRLLDGLAQEFEWVLNEAALNGARPAGPREIRYP